MNRNSLDISIRLLASTLISYLLASVFSVILTKLIAGTFTYPLGQTVLLSSMLSYVVMFALFTYCFSQVPIKTLLTRLLLLLLALFTLNYVYQPL